jgi:hypothetical protein
MNVALAMLAQCSGICMLPGWKNSKGAQIEYSLALASGKIIMYEDVRKGMFNGDYDKTKK